MELVPLSVGRTSRAWDEQHLDLEGAAKELEAADATGFTDAVKGAGASFTAAWEGFARRLGTDAEARADALRQVIHTYLTSEDHVRMRMGNLSVDPLSVYDLEVR